MTDAALIVTNKDRTAKSYIDFSRPKAMTDADNIFAKIAARQGSRSSDAVAIAETLSQIFQDPKNNDADTLWHSISEKLYDGKDIALKAKTSEDKVLTAFSLFYAALNQIDGGAKTTKDLQSFQTTYLKAKNKAISRILTKETGMAKVNLQRAMNTIDKRLTNVIARYDTKVDNKEVAGSKL